MRRCFLAALLALGLSGGVAQAQTPYGPGPAPNPVSPYAAAPLFGTGADGNVTISSGTVTLTRDMQYANLTISSTGKILTSGYRIFVSGTLDLSNAGAAALAVSAGGLANTVGPGYFQVSGVAGGTGAGASGNGGGRFTAPTLGGSVGAAGNGGSGTSAGGAGGAALSPTSAQATYAVTAPTTVLMQAGTGIAGYYYVGGLAGASGGAGGGDGTFAGGASFSSGSGGGVLGIWARYIQRGTNSTASIIAAKGNNPAPSGNSAGGNAGGGGGSSGGGGGFVYIVCESLLGSVIPYAIDVSGGNGGAGGNGSGTGLGGGGGSGGSGGNAQILVLSAPSFTASSYNAPGTAGSTTATATGAVGGAGAIVRMSL